MPDTGRVFIRTALPAALCGAALLILGACGSVAPMPIAPAGSIASPTPGVAPSPTYDPNEFDLTPVLPVATKWSEPPTPSPQPTQDPSTGLSVYINADFASPPTAEEYASWFGMYVIGRVTKILPAQWSTPDGSRPSDVTQTYVDTDTYTIITPVVVELDRPPLLNRYEIDVSSGTIVLAAFGGKVGKDEIDINDPSQHLHLGDHLLIGVSDEPFIGTTMHIPYTTPAGPAWTLGMVYHLIGDREAIAAMPNATPVATQDLIQAIEEAARANP